MTQMSSSTMNKVVVVFDLDDTIYKEIDFLESAYQEIAETIAPIVGVQPNELSDKMFQLYQEGENVFEYLTNKYSLPYNMNDLLQKYREHYPKIQLKDEHKEILEGLKARNITIGILTDGRSITQRNKIKALGLYDYVMPNDIIISEEFGYGKPSVEGYEHFMKSYPDASYFYIGDNPKKDFIAPNRLGWTTICLRDNGKNIHKQMEASHEAKAKFVINELTEILERI